MDTGRLNKRVQFGSIKTESDDYGQAIESFTEKFKAWANIKYISGRESLLANVVTVNQTIITIVCRYRSDLTLKDKVKYDGQTWEITNIAPDERNNFMNVTAEITQ
ncbi:phage head closure protein [Psychromonas sp. KJ10-2]|uniref:phage head closure protein n=1 Tax=Psychromonas sp. KJ10-2 TaxID=3391822 RepID=UPI0039B4C2F5